MTENQTPNQLHWGMTEKNFVALMHISQFAGMIAPVLGWVLPLVMWLTEKDKSAVIDEHGKNIINWLISLTIYLVISTILTVILVGIVLLVGLAVIAIVFPIIAAVKAGDGIVWKYPLTINFIK